MTVFAFEDIAEDLPLLPLAARRALDASGLRLSLGAWKGLPLSERQVLVAAGVGARVDVARVRAAVAAASPAPTDMSAADESALDGLPEALHGRLGAERWSRLSLLERFALRHLCIKNKPGRVAEALAEIAPSPTHLDEHGDARMVDVGEKPVTHRRAVASAVVSMRPATARLIGAGAEKGDVLATARIAGIMAAKRTHELIPLCHALALSRVAIGFDVDEERGRVVIKAAADAHDKTGVEMEAMTAAAVAALTIYDMLKGVERGMRIEEVVLLEKVGGRTGHYRREPEGV